MQIDAVEPAHCGTIPTRRHRPPGEAQAIATKRHENPGQGGDRPSAYRRTYICVAAEESCTAVCIILASHEEFTTQAIAAKKRKRRKTEPNRRPSIRFAGGWIFGVTRLANDPHSTELNSGSPRLERPS